MTGHDLLLAIPLALAAAACLVSAVGVLAMRGAYNKLHFLAPVSLLGSFFVVLAIVLDKGWSQESVKAALVMLVLWISNPVLTQATARAHKIRSEAPREPGQAP